MEDNSPPAKVRRAAAYQQRIFPSVKYQCLPVVNGIYILYTYIKGVLGVLFEWDSIYMYIYIPIFTLISYTVQYLGNFKTSFLLHFFLYLIVGLQLLFKRDFICLEIYIHTRYIYVPIEFLDLFIYIYYNIYIYNKLNHV